MRSAELIELWRGGQRESLHRGDAVICIVGGFIVAGFGGGQLSMLTADRYKTTAQEVAATFRTVNGIPQYIAVPQ